MEMARQRAERCLVERGTSPASYLIGLALEEHFGHRFRRGDKSAWITTIVFDGSVYELNDWKRGAWDMYGPRNEEKVRLLLRKLSAAAKIVDRDLAEEAQESVEKGDFALAHQSSRLMSYYLIHRENAERLITLKPGDEPPTLVSEHVTEGGSKFTRYLNTAMNKYFEEWRKADAAAATAVILFFGLMEIIFDAFFVFGERRGLTYREFRNLDWKERFRFVVDVTQSPAKEAYEEMGRIQARHRNIISHGAPAVLVPHALLGFIPTEADQLFSPQLNPMYAFDAEDVKTTFETFDRTLDVFKNHPTLWFAFMYVQTPLLLYLDESRVKKITAHTGSREEFEQLIDHRLEMLDRITNMED